jgi:hypothetical protein
MSRRSHDRYTIFPIGNIHIFISEIADMTSSPTLTAYELNSFAEDQSR